MEITTCESCKKLAEDNKRLQLRVDWYERRSIARSSQRPDDFIIKKFFLRPSDVDQFTAANPNADLWGTGPKVGSTEFYSYSFRLHRSDSRRLTLLAQDLATGLPCK